MQWFIGICGREHINIPTLAAASKSPDGLVNINVGGSTPALPTAGLPIDISEPIITDSIRQCICIDIIRSWLIVLLWLGKVLISVE